MVKLLFLFKDAQADTPSSFLGKAIVLFVWMLSLITSVALILLLMGFALDVIF